MHYGRHSTWQLDFIWASPPCQAHPDVPATAPGRVADPHLKLTADVRQILGNGGASWAIENVVGARPEMPGAFVLRGRFRPATGSTGRV